MMSESKQLSSTELEQLLHVRRRQEAMLGLRLLADRSAEMGKEDRAALKPSGLAPANERLAPAKAVPVPLPPPPPAPTVPVPDDNSFHQPQPQLNPLPARRGRSARRATHPLLRALTRGLDKIVDTLIVLVLILFVLALGFWIYDMYVDPLLRRAGASPAPGDSSSSLWPGQGRLSSPEEALNAPLPFVPYSTTVSIQHPPIPEPTAAPGTAMPALIEIPAIQLRTAVVEVTIDKGVWQVAEYAAGYHRGTARPGTVGNTVISGHKGLAGAVFARLEDVKIGDTIWITAGSYQYEYRVTEKKKVWPHQIEVMAPTSKPVLTLITCTIYDTQRLIVVADFIREYTAGTGTVP